MQVHHEVSCESFVLSVPSASRAAGTTGTYSVYPSREFPGKYKVRVQCIPFYTSANITLELRMRVAGATYQSTDNAQGYQRVLSTIPGYVATEGTLYVNEGIRGPIDVTWVDPSGTATGVLPEHTLYLDFQKI